MSIETLYDKFVGQTAKQIAESSDAPTDLKVMASYQKEAAILTSATIRNGQIARLEWASKKGSS